MIEFDELKKIITISRKNEPDKIYFNNDDIFFNTDISKIYGIQHQELIFIKDNCKFNTETKTDYKIKVYNTITRKISTCFISKNEKIVDDIMLIFDYMRAFNTDEIEIIMTGDIYTEQKNIGIYSEYFKKGIYLI